jgi:hypothetical protein
MVAQPSPDGLLAEVFRGHKTKVREIKINSILIKAFKIRHRYSENVNRANFSYITYYRYIYWSRDSSI